MVENSLFYVQKALDKYEGLLLSLPNVVGVGIGKSNRLRDFSKYLVKVYVSKKIDQNRLPDKDRIPKLLEIDIENHSGKRMKIRTAIEEIGEPEFE